MRSMLHILTEMIYLFLKSSSLNLSLHAFSHDLEERDIFFNNVFNTKQFILRHVSTL